MKNFTLSLTRNKLLGAALLTAFVGAPLVQNPTVVEAQSRRDRRDDKGNNGRRGNDRYDRDRYDRDRDYRTNYDRDNRGNNQTYSGRVTNVRNDRSFDLRANGRIYNVYAVGDLPRRLNENDEVRVYGRLYGDNDIRNANVRITDNNNRRDNRNNDNRYDRDRYDRDRDYRNDYDRNNRGNNQTYNGRVTNVRNDRSFDLRANGRTYNVYAVGNLPRRLSDNDQVRVYGRAYGDNDIRNANVVLTGNNDGRGGNYTNGRYDPNGKLGGGFGNRNNNNGNYQTVTGEVTDVKNDREFDIRIGGTTYNVYASTGTRGLRDGDTVRVYGQRYGDNDIRNANVTVTRNNRGGGLFGNRDNDRNDNNNYGPYRTFTGTVTDRKNDREFDVRIDGRTYNVYASSDTRGLDDGDEVRIYGRTYGDNDIRNANVRITRNR